MPLSLSAAADDDGRRLDRILRKALPDFPLSAIHRLLRKGRVLVDGKKAKAGRLVREGETITLTTLPDAEQAKPPRNAAGAGTEFQHSPNKEKALVVLFEGAGILALDKPAGLAVHGGEENGASLDELVLSYLKPKLPPSLSFRPGPLHRLDKPSSGVIVFSASLEGARLFSDLLRERKIKKVYLALVEGAITKEEIWEDDLARDRKQKKTFALSAREESGTVPPGKEAITRITPLAGNAFFTLIRAEIETGRTHQIRAQAAFHGHPLAGDRKYGGKYLSLNSSGGPAANGFLLHAWKMELPETPSFPRLIEAPPPPYFTAKTKELFGAVSLSLRDPENLNFPRNRF